MIGNAKWYLGGFDGYSIIPKEIYEVERSNNVYGTNTKNLIVKMGLPYGSDYGFAINDNTCLNSNMHDWHGNNYCALNNWMMQVSNSLWTITQNTSCNYSVLALIEREAGLFYFCDNSSVYHYAVYPTLYLSPDTIEVDGSGTKDNPYILSLE